MKSFRIIASIVVRNGIVVQSLSFSQYLPIGKPEFQVEAFDRYGADEILLLDITATRTNQEPNYEQVTRVSSSGLLPLAVGGGVSSVEIARKLVAAGADKVILNHAAWDQRDTISSIASSLGSQCAIVSLDLVMEEATWFRYDYLLGRPSRQTATEAALEAEKAGAGELFLNFPQRDGLRGGFELEAINQICEAVRIPVIACGGYGYPEHLVALFSQTKASAACVGNAWLYTEHSITLAKEHLLRKGLPVRLPSSYGYEDAVLDESGRLSKRPDEVLENLLFTRLEPEII